MKNLKYTTDEDGFALLETEEGFLQYFRGYRIQLSATPQGIGDNGSSANINVHFRNVQAHCKDAAAKTKFIQLVALAHVYQAVKKYPNVLKQIKTDTTIFEEFMDHLIVDDFNQYTEENFKLAEVLKHLNTVRLTEISELDNVDNWEGVNKDSSQVHTGIKDTTAYTVDAKTLKGYSLDFKEFVVQAHGDQKRTKLTEAYVDFAKIIILNLAGFIEEYDVLYPPHFYINKKREDTIGKSNIFGMAK